MKNLLRLLVLALFLLLFEATLPVFAQDDDSGDYVDCEVEPDAEECSDYYDDEYIDCEAEPDAEECSDYYDDEYIDCEAEPDAEECSDYYDDEYIDCEAEPDAEECSDYYDDEYIDCEAEPDAEECSDYSDDGDYIDCDAEPDAEECADYSDDGDYIDCDAEPDAEECYDYEYVDCTVEVDAPECELLTEWDGEEDLPAWYAENAIVIDCGVEDAEECDWYEEDWIAEYGDGYLSVIDYEDGYIVIFELGEGDYGDNFDDWVYEPDDGEFSEDADISFGVDDEELIDPESPDGSIDAELEGTAADIWALVQEIVPAELLAKVSGFELFNSDDGTLAYVYPDENNPGKWILGVNASEVGDRAALAETIVHEFAHIITLDEGQFGSSSGSCSTVEIEEGCALPNSYLAPFFDEFWAEIDAEFQDIMRLPESQQEDALYAFYQRHQDQFVSDYSSTNIAEDMAESFAAFVSRPRPSGNSIADQKILFFYQFPELVQLRDRMRAGMGL